MVIRTVLQQNYINWFVRISNRKYEIQETEQQKAKTNITEC